MRFRLAIARGLLPDTPVLLMDEPTLGLDPHSARKIRDYVKEKLVGEEGKTVFLATNNLSEAEYLCDRVAVIHEGSVKVVDSPARIRGNRALEEVFLELTGEKPT
jgi:ABC-2 type transport system ATP-binding protein